MQDQTTRLMLAVAYCLWQGVTTTVYADMRGAFMNVLLGLLTGAFATLMARSRWLVLFVPLAMGVAFGFSGSFLNEGAELSWQLFGAILAASTLGAALVVELFILRKSRPRSR